MASYAGNLLPPADPNRYAAVGAGAGGLSGAFLGGLGGGIGGGAGGTLVAPGIGTVGGAYGGAVAGAAEGGVLGAGAGGAIGYGIGSIVYAAQHAGDVVAPSGTVIGTPNSGSPGGKVRNLPGGDQAAQDLFNDLSQFGAPGNKPGYPGPTVELPNGGFAGYRGAQASGSGVPAVDVKIPGTFQGKFHFP